MVAFRKAIKRKKKKQLCTKRLTAKSVQSAALTLQSIDDVHCSDGLSLGVLSVGDGIADDVLQKHFENPTGLFVDEAADTLHSTSASQAADGGLCDTLDVVTQDLSVTLGASLSKTFASFATSRHDEKFAFSLNTSKDVLAAGSSTNHNTFVASFPAQIRTTSSEFVYLHDACARWAHPSDPLADECL